VWLARVAVLVKGSFYYVGDARPVREWVERQLDGLSLGFNTRTVLNVFALATDGDNFVQTVFLRHKLIRKLLLTAHEATRAPLKVFVRNHERKI
jgi:hypothetical protein